MIIMEVWIFFSTAATAPKRPTIEYSYWTCVSGHICFLICDFCWPPVRYSLYTTNNEKQPCGTIFRPTEMQGRRFFNTSYLTDLYISFTLKLESRQNFCSSRSIRSSTYYKKNIFEIPPCWSHFASNSFSLLVLRKITISVTKMTFFLHGGKSEIFFYHMYLT